MLRDNRRLEALIRPGVAGGPVTVAVDGQAAGQAPWASASPWRPVPPGRHRLTATGGTDVTVDVGAGCGVTVVTGQADLAPSSLRAVVIPDCSPPRLGPGQARITAVVVTSPSFGLVEVDVNGGRQRVEPHTVVPGTVLKAGENTSVIMRHPHTGAVFVKRDVRLEEGTAYTLALVGGGEAGATLAVVEDATQARAVPAPGQLIHTGVGDRSPLVPIAAILGAALVAAAVRATRRGLTVALVAVALLLTGCPRRDRPLIVGPPVEQPRSPGTPTAPPRVPAAPFPAPPPAAPAVAAPPASLRIASLGLDLPVGRLDGVTGLPRSLPMREVAWLTGTAGAGAGGTTAIVGHTGSGPFGRLGGLRSGDPITVTDAAGHAHTYKVVSVSAHRKDAFPQEVWAPQRMPTLVLITCTGGRDPRTGLHVDNLIVRAIAA
jgi:hypothetical protein